MVEESTLQERYSIEERIASGGMGTVFRARDERLNREVALKVLREDFAHDSRFVERFRREARAVAALSHPNIANVYDYGQDDDRHFIVMEYAPGNDLSKLLGAGDPLAPDRAARIGVQICRALGHAHSVGIIHRDVKPGNVIVSDDDHVKVTDFGIARAVGDSTLTATGSVLGTAQYLSPEQSAGEPIGPASDLYSTGIVLYEMLTGSPPFTGDSAIAVALRHTSEEVPRPSVLNPNVPPPLDEVVAKATERAPEKRFATAEQMAEALAEAADGSGGAPLPAVAPTLAMGGPPATRRLDEAVPRRPPGDNRRLLRPVLLALLAAAVIGGGWLAWRVATGADGGTTERGRPGGGGTAAEGRQPQEKEGSSGESPTPPETPGAQETARPEETPAPQGTSIPGDAIGADADEVEDALAEAGFEVAIEEIDSELDKGLVVDTDPGPGSLVVPGEDTITLLVSNGELAKGPPDKPPGQEKKEEEEGDD